MDIFSNASAAAVEKVARDAREAAKPRPTEFDPLADIPHGEPRHPDALVLLTVAYECRCGNTHEAPNPRVLFRYGSSLVQPNRWRSDYNQLPRECRTTEVPLTACDNCFYQRTFSLTDMKPKETL